MPNEGSYREGNAERAILEDVAGLCCADGKCCPLEEPAESLHAHAIKFQGKIIVLNYWVLKTRDLIQIDEGVFGRRR